MKLLTDLFTTDYGIMSISGIGFMLCMAGFFIWYFNHKMNEADGKAGK
jgi:energy-converting hydrogenase Eha subunit G